MKNTKVPSFKSIEEEAKYWDSKAFIEEWKRATPVEGINFEEGLETKGNDEIVYLRIPADVKREVKKIAGKRHRKMSDLLRLWVISKVEEDRKLAYSQSV